MSEVLDLTCALVERPSVTPDDAGCQALIAARLAPLGFRAESIAFCGRHRGGHQVCERAATASPISRGPQAPSHVPTAIAAGNST